MTQPRHINYKDDFVLRERFRDSAGNLMPLPDGDALLVIFKDHNLCEGSLKRELHLRLVNDTAAKSALAADTATAYAREAAAATNARCEVTEQTRLRLEAVADRAEQVAAPVPDGLRVETPAPITLRNPVPCFISARVLPAGALQNIIFQAFGGSAGVEPDGRILPFRPGVTRVHVIPTAGTRFYKTVEVRVVAPVIRLASPSALRLDKAGNIRLT